MTSRARTHALALLAAAALAGCASVAPQRAGEAARCEQTFAVADAAIERAGVRDAQGAALTEFPYLRTDRFLASFAAESRTAAELAQLVDLMAAAGRRAREIELANLPAAERRELDAAHPPGIAGALRACAQTMRRADTAQADFFTRLAQAAQVPDDYDTWKRVVGLYALTSLGFAVGVRNYERETLALFAAPLDRLERHGTAVRYSAGNARLSSDEVAGIIARAPRNLLGIPRIERSDAMALAATFAPDLVVDEASDADRLGVPVFAPDGTRTVAPRPAAFVRLAFTRVGERVLPQIVYTFWFSARPLASAFDILGGSLDGVVWRVTIDLDGRPLLFDSIHPCGCYHQFFPTARVRLRELAPTVEETALVPQWLPRLEAIDRLTLLVASGTHYLQRILVDEPATQDARRYLLATDNRLRRLPHPNGGTRSFYGSDGIVPGSERGERYLFWPLGVREPGAMRQWTRHATAFIGRRHFDDPRLIERYFIAD